MDAIANADRVTQTNEATAVLLDKAARIIGFIAPGIQSGAKMTDIVERLRTHEVSKHHGGCADCYGTVMDEAADEIERLRAENQTAWNKADDERIKAADEIERMRAENQTAWNKADDERIKAADEIERLRAENQTAWNKADDERIKAADEIERMRAEVVLWKRRVDEAGDLLERSKRK